METTILLLLGCAVQCEDKAHHINTITSLEISTQQAIVQWIRMVSVTKNNAPASYGLYHAVDSKKP